MNEIENFFKKIECLYKCLYALHSLHVSVHLSHCDVFVACRLNTASVPSNSSSLFSFTTC